MKKIFYNGRIFTGGSGSDREFADYLVADDNIITEVGTGYTPDVPKEGDAGNACEIIDLNGRLMLPGFIDSHAHPFTSAFQLSQIVIDFESTLPGVLEAIREYVEAHKEKESFFGIGYSEAIFDETAPRKEMLDEICKDKPMIIVAASGHESWANSRALEITGVTSRHRDPVAGVQYYVRDCDGEPTGHLIEGDPMREVIDAIKPFVHEEVEKTLTKIFEDFSSYGVTTIGDCGFAPYIKKQAEGLLDSFLAGKQMKQRIFGSNHINSLSEVDGWEEHLAHLHSKYDDDFVSFRTFKIVNDGIVENCSAAMLEPFIGQEKPVLPLIYDDDLKRICLRAAELGYDVHLHGIGDRTVRENLSAAKAIRDAGYEDTIITNAHSQCVADGDIPLFARYNVIANTSAVWHYGNDDNDEIMGERANKMFPLNSIIKAGAMMTGSSDFPGDEMGPQPLRAIETGMTRQLNGQPEAKILLPETERISLDEMLKSYTCNAAYQLRMKDKIGSIECGKYADFVILDRDIFTCDVYEIHDIPVYMTIMNGNITYKK